MASVTPAPTSVHCEPRVTYRGLIVLSRRKWHVPSSLLPSSTTLARAEYFVAINRWRLELGIPEQVYVRVIPVPPKPTSEAVERDAKNGALKAEEGGSLQDDEGAGPQELRDLRAERPEVGGSRDYRKPQFIDFANPILVDLFQHIGGRYTLFNVIMEECLPPLNDAIAHGDDRYVTELILQLEFAAENQSSVVSDELVA